MEGLLTVNEAAMRLGKDPETIRRWIWRGRLRSQKVGGQHFIAPEDLDSAVHKGGRLSVGEPPVAYATRPAPQQAPTTARDPDERTDEELWAQLDAEEAESEAYRAAHPEEFPQTYEELLQRLEEMEKASRAWDEANKHKSLLELEEEHDRKFPRVEPSGRTASDDIREMRALRDAQIDRAVRGL